MDSSQPNSRSAMLDQAVPTARSESSFSSHGWKNFPQHFYFQPPSHHQPSSRFLTKIPRWRNMASSSGSWEGRGEIRDACYVTRPGLPCLPLYTRIRLWGDVRWLRERLNNMLLRWSREKYLRSGLFALAEDSTALTLTQLPPPQQQQLLLLPLLLLLLTLLPIHS